MRGDRAIIATRKAGQKPAHVVLLPADCRLFEVGDVALSLDEKPDLRFLIGLPVTLVVREWSASAGAMWERVKAAQPAFAIFACLTWDDVGFQWEAGEECAFGDKESGNGKR